MEYPKPDERKIEYDWHDNRLFYVWYGIDLSSVDNLFISSVHWIYWGPAFIADFRVILQYLLVCYGGRC